MKIREDMVLKKVGGTWVVFPIGNALNEYNRILRVNETGAYIWELMTTELGENQVVRALAEEYDIDEKIARKTVVEFTTKLQKHGII